MRTIVVFLLSLSVQAFANPRMIQVQGATTPFQTLEKLWNSGSSISFESIPTLAQSLNQKRGLRELKNWVAESTKLEELKPGGWNFRHTFTKTVVVRPGAPGAGPVFGGVSELKETLSVVDIVACPRAKLTDCNFTKEESDALFDKIAPLNIKWEQTSDGLGYKVGDQNTWRSMQIRKSGDVLVWKYTEGRAGKSKSIYSYAWYENFK